MTPILFPPERGPRALDPGTVAAWNRAFAEHHWQPGRILHAIDCAGSPDRLAWLALLDKHRTFEREDSDDRLSVALRKVRFPRGWFEQGDFVLRRAGR